MSDFAFPVSSESLPLLVRSRDLPAAKAGGGAPALSERAKLVGGDRAGAGGEFVELEPTGEELLATLWSKAFSAIALKNSRK